MTAEESLEERLCRTLDTLMFLGDFWALQAVAPDYMRGELSSSACQAATEVCRRHAADLRQLLDGLSAPMANWTPSGRRAAGRSPRRQPRET
jgi:hypothetical protein